MTLKEYIQQRIDKKLDVDIRVTGLADSVCAGTVSFLENVKFLDSVKDNKNIVAVFIREKDAVLVPHGICTIITESPKAAFFDLHNAYYMQNLDYGANNIAHSAKIHPSAIIADRGVIIGENVTVGANSTILSGVQIGKNTTIGSNCVVGYDGFHVYTGIDGIKKIVIHDGKVVIGDNVDIQASVTIDKGLMGRDTVIENECKIDNLVHIAHRVHIGAKTLVASGATIAGSTNIGRDVWIGPRAVIANRISICDNARILLGAVVIRNIKQPISVSGNFAVEHIKHLRSQC